MEIGCFEDEISFKNERKSKDDFKNLRAETAANIETNFMCACKVFGSVPIQTFNEIRYFGTTLQNRRCRTTKFLSARTMCIKNWINFIQNFSASKHIVLIFDYQKCN